MALVIQIRRDTATNWTRANPILAQGEMGIELDTNRFKFGDGVTAWNNLGYFSAGSVASVNGLTGDVVITLADLATSIQMDAIDSGATSTNIGQITTNQNAIGTLSSLTTTAKTNLVSAINEVNDRTPVTNAEIDEMFADES